MILDQWRADLSSDEITFYLIAVCVIALVFFGLILYYLKRARLIEDTPTSRFSLRRSGLCGADWGGFCW